jgi:hypothetical protein
MSKLMINFKFLTIFLIISLSSAYNIIPDPQNPLLIKTPQTGQSQLQIIFRFSLSQNSPGLNYNQFIGINFPFYIATQLAFNDKPKWTCDLTDGTNKIQLTPAASVSSPQSLAFENTVAYCKLTDSAVAKLTAGSSYIFTLTLSSTITTQFIRNISLFTSTANHQEKILIDYSPIFGSIGLYSAWDNKGPLQIITSVVNNGQSINPYNIFSVQVDLQVNSNININDFNLVIKYPSNVVTAPNAIQSTAIDALDPMKNKLNGTLNLVSLNDSAVMITGIIDTLTTGKQFRLVLSGFTALDNVVGNTALDTNIRVMLYYKNSYSVYSSSLANVFKITTIPLTLAVAHPENWDIWRNGAWPVKFTINIPNINITKGSYLVIQHTNAKDGLNNLSFIAASCDFSETASFDNSLGRRPNCYPLRQDNNYTNRSSTNVYSGSGIFVYAPTIAANTKIILTVWIFADDCGGGVKYNAITDTNNANVTFEFQASLYKTIDTSAVDETRIVNINNVLLAQAPLTLMSSKCWNSVIQTRGGEQVPVQLRFNDSIFTSNINLPQDPKDLISEIDVTLYKEVYDWGLAVNMNPTTTNSYGVNLSDNTKYTETFLYSSNTAALTGASYFLMRAKIGIYDTTNIYNYFALPVTYINANVVLTLSRTHFLFTSKWFTKGDDNCYVSWSFYNEYNLNNFTTSTNFGSKNTWDDIVFDASTQPYIALNNNGTSDIATDDIRSEYRNNFITNFFANTQTPPTGSTQGVTIDVTKSVISNDPATFKITSTQMNAFRDPSSLYTDVPNNGNLAPAASWLPINPLYLSKNATGNALYIGLFSSCLKWATTSPTIKSIYTYIDIQWNFSYNNITNRVNRFIKLYPEGGVFQDYNTKFSTNNLGTSNPLMIHYAYVNTSSKGVCLIELDANALKTLGDGLSDSLVLWIHYGVLIETDYTDSATNYPIAPLQSSISAYGLQTGVPRNKTFNMAYFYENNGVLDRYTNLPNESNGTYIQKTFYQVFMGSILILNGFKDSSILPTGTATQSIMIPFYCPYSDDTYSYTNPRLPTVVAAWMNITSHSDIKSLNSYIGYKNSFISATTNIVRYSMIMNRIADALSTPGGVSSAKFNSGLQPPSVVNITLRFSQYTDQSKGLYLFNSLLATANLAQHCTGQILFINKSISVLPSPTPFIGSTNNNISSGVYINSSKVFYVFGKPFSNAILTGLNNAYTYVANEGSTTIDAGDGKQDISKYYFPNVVRPDVTAFNNFNTADNVAYFCTSVANDLRTMMTNYSYNLNSFILDYNPSKTAWNTPIYSFDINESVFKDDNAGNIGLKLKTSVTVPAGTTIQVASTTNFTKNTICGLVNGTMVNECNTLLTTVTCPSIQGTDFQICCYNILMTDTFSLSSLLAIFPINQSFTNVMNNIIYDGQDTIANSSFDTGNAAGQIAGQATISEVKFIHVLQTGAYAKVKLTVNLPRNLVRDMQLTLKGDFTYYKIIGITPRCVVTTNTTGYGSDWEKGDAIIDSCTVSLVDTDKPILITTKKSIYKCGASFSKTLYISMWPVQVQNIPADTDFIINMSLKSGDTIADNSVSNIAQVTGLNPNPPAIQMDNLCIPTVNPKIPGEYADYTFTFDLTTNANSLTLSPNELMIFFPYDLYSSLQNVNCYQGANILNCFFLDEGILVIRFNTPLTKGTNVSIIISNILNPDNGNNMIYVCNVNNVDFITETRTSLITGSGKYVGGITNNPTQNGNLIISSVPAFVSSSSSRDSATYTFRVSVDKSTGLSTLPINISNSPFFMIKLTDDYMDYLNQNLTIKLNVNTANGDISQVTEVTPVSVIHAYGKIFINLPDPFNLPAEFLYVDIIIGGLVNPYDKVTNMKGSYSVVLSNSDNSAYYKIYQNLNTFSFSAMKTPIDGLIANNRGANFNFDNSKWVLDVQNGTNLNTLTIQPGRFITSYLAVRPNQTLVMSPSAAAITLKDSTFKLQQQSYNINSSINEPIPFMIGVPCSTATGIYVLTMTLTIPTTTPAVINNWANLAPLIVTVNRNNLGTIAYQPVPNIPTGGSMAIGYTLSEPNVDSLTISWSLVQGSATSAGVKFSDINVPIGTVTNTYGGGLSNLYSQFTITDATFTNTIKYSAQNPNQCYKWTNNVLDLNIGGDNVSISQSFDFTNSFAHFNGDDIPDFEKDSFKFKLNLPIAPIYYYCHLRCQNINFPSEDASFKVFFTDTDSAKFRFGVYSTALSNQDINFTGLIRGQRYKMKCLFETTQADVTLRSTRYVTLDSLSTINYEIKASKPTPTQCAKFSFTSDPGQEATKKIVHYCQSIFSAPGLLSNGCPICMDSLVTYMAPGLSLLPENKCYLPPGQNSNPLLATSIENSFYNFSVCIVYNPQCSTNTTGTQTPVDYYNSFLGALSNASSFNTNLLTGSIPLASVTTYTDNTAPDLSFVNISNLSFDMTQSTVTFKATSISSLKCFAKVQQSTTAPKFEEIFGCTQTGCARLDIALTGTTATIGPVNPGFAYSQIYKIYIACFNNIPYPTTRSSVTNPNNASFRTPDNPTPASNNNNNNTPPPPSTNSTIPTTIIDIPDNYTLMGQFIFNNYDTDDSIPDKNTIKFTYQLPFSPVNVYCKLNCLSSNIPTDDKVRDTIAQTNDALTQSYFKLYTQTLKSENILFSGLVRGLRYRLKCIADNLNQSPSLRESAVGVMEKYNKTDGTQVYLSPSDIEPTNCIQYKFEDVLDNTYLGKMKDFCNSYFTHKNTFAISGCTQCVLYNDKIDNPIIPAEPKCTVNTNRLRYLQVTDPTATGSSTAGSTTTTTTTTTTNTDTTSTTAAPTSTDMAANNSTVTDTSAASTTTPNSTATNSTSTKLTPTTIPPVTLPKSQSIITLCAVPIPWCQSDIRGRDSYTTLFNRFANSTILDSKLKTNIGTGMPKLRQTIIYSDAYAPDISSLLFTNFITDQTGFITFTASYSVPLTCQFMIKDDYSTAPPTLDEIKSCASHMCGTMKPGPVGEAVSVATGDNLKPSTIYNVFVACSYDIPRTVVTSAIKTAWTFNTFGITTSSTSVPDANKINNTNNTVSEFCLNNPNDSDCPTSTSGADYYRMTMTAMILVSLTFILI